MIRKILAVVLACALPSFGTYAAVGTGVTAGGTILGGVTSPSYNTTGADLIVVVCANDQSVAACTVSDSNSNTWTALTGFTNANSRVQMFFCQGCTVGSGHTFTIAATTAACIAVQAFSGSASTPTDQQAGNSVTAATSITVNSITPTQSNELVVTSLSDLSTATPTINGGFSTPVATVFLGSVHYGCGVSYLIQTSATAASPTWSYTNTSNASSSIVSFKAAGAVTFIPQVGAFIVGP